jgi:hypothetical protein
MFMGRLRVGDRKMEMGFMGLRSRPLSALKFAASKPKERTGNLGAFFIIRA